MRIDKIIFSTDDNPLYLGFWPFISKWTKERLGVTPVLFHVTTEETDFYEDQYGLVKKFKANPKLPSSFQAQLVRMWGTRYFLDEFCMTSDIDMMMVDKNYFMNGLENYNDEDMLIYGSDAYDSSRPECTDIYGGDRYPICYNLAKGSTFEKILLTDKPFDEYMQYINDFYFPFHDSDEMYFGWMVNNTNHGVNVVKLRRGFTTKFYCPNRFERPLYLSSEQQRELKNKDIIDIHLVRPYEKYQTQIQIIKEMIV
jgi:hypothetical protein